MNGKQDRFWESVMTVLAFALGINYLSSDLENYFYRGTSDFTDLLWSAGVMNVYALSGLLAISFCHFLYLAVKNSKELAVENSVLRNQNQNLQNQNVTLSSQVSSTVSAFEALRTQRQQRQSVVGSVTAASVPETTPEPQAKPSKKEIRRRFFHS